MTVITNAVQYGKRVREKKPRDIGHIVINSRHVMLADVGPRMDTIGEARPTGTVCVRARGGGGVNYLNILLCVHEDNLPRPQSTHFLPMFSVAQWSS